MINNKKVLAFIGARSGSKGLKDKNIKAFKGLPLMVWTIKAALASKYIDEVIVSSDSERYGKIAEAHGATFILRPNTLSGDDAALIEAIKHGYDQVKAEHGQFDVIVNLQPTSPLRTNVHIDQALALFVKQADDTGRVFSCYQVKPKFAWLMSCNAQGFAQFILPSEQDKKLHARQSLDTILLPNGAIFILPANDLSTFYNDKTLPYLMTEAESIDIDVQADFDLAKQLFDDKNSLQ